MIQSVAATIPTTSRHRESLEGLVACSEDQTAQLRWLMDLLIDEGDRLKSELAFAETAGDDLTRLADHFARGISLDGWSDDEIRGLTRFRVFAVLQGLQLIGDLLKSPKSFTLWSRIRGSTLWQGLHQRAQFFYDVGLVLSDWRPPPQMVVFDIVGRCNLACHHCNQVAPTATGPFDEIRTRPEDFSRDQILEVFRQSEILRNANTGFAGGEIFLRKDIHEILAGLSRMGFRYYMLTNGTYPRKLKELIADPDVRRSLKTVHFSMDGIGAAHEAVRGKGTYALLEKSFGIARNAGLPALALAVAQPTNLESMREMCETVARNPDSFPQFRIQLAFLDADYWQSNRQYIRPLLGPLWPEDYYLSLDPALNRSGLACPSGSDFCRVEPDTRIKACGYDSVAGKPTNLVMGFLRDFDFNFDDLWRSQGAVDVRHRVKSCVGCAATCIRK